MTVRKSIDVVEVAYNRQVHERLGQFFVNRYIAGSWAELFFEEDYSKARDMIASWLRDHQYEFTMPPVVREFQ